ncbi:hemagglutinin, partial [Providencia rettgeri]
MTDTSKPYVGTQTPTSSNGVNNGSVQNFAPWGANVTGEMGDSLGYITPSNTANTGGVWAGNKAAALTFGNAQTGFFADSSGAQVKNSNLNLTGNKVTNLSDGVADKDATNVSQLKKSAQDTLNSANTYTDNKATETLQTANTYTDNKATQTLQTANTYTDNKATQTLQTANTYTDNKATQTLQTANTYTDNKATQTLQTANTYTD